MFLRHWVFGGWTTHVVVVVIVVIHVASAIEVCRPFVLMRSAILQMISG